MSGCRSRCWWASVPGSTHAVRRSCHRDSHRPASGGRVPGAQGAQRARASARATARLGPGHSEACLVSADSRSGSRSAAHPRRQAPWRPAWSRQLYRRGPRRDLDAHPPGTRRRAASVAAVDEPDREPPELDPARDAQREALEGWVDSAALDGQRGPGNGEVVPSSEGSPGHASASRRSRGRPWSKGCGQGGSNRVDRQPTPPLTFNGRQDNARS